MDRKDYLVWENDRNKRNHKLYTDILHHCFGADGVIIGHHLTFGGEEAPDEIPSADTLIFDHPIAQMIWGDGYLAVLEHLAVLPAEQRDIALSTYFYKREQIADDWANAMKDPAKLKDPNFWKDELVID
jgi:hypothetical protein